MLSSIRHCISRLNLFQTFLDWRRFTINERARYSYIFMMALAGGSWIWATIVQVGYTRNPPSFDWVDDGFGRGWALYIIMQVNLYVLPSHILRNVSSTVPLARWSTSELVHNAVSIDV